MIESKKGCVYFFRHVGLEPIKIGYSSHESPIKRFNQFKTYAPFGAEIIGFIQTNEAKEIESKLHLKYSSKRLDGEWFLISEEDCKNEIDFYTSKEDIKQRNEFQVAWAKKLHDKKNKKPSLAELVNDSNSNFGKIKTIYKDNPKFNRAKVAELMGISRRQVINIVKKIEGNQEPLLSAGGNDSNSIFDDIKKIYKEYPDFNRSKVSELLGVSRQTVHRFIKQLEEKH